jgi:hypothetical protein
LGGGGGLGGAAAEECCCCGGGHGVVLRYEQRREGWIIFKRTFQDEQKVSGEIRDDARLWCAQQAQLKH